MFQIVNQLLIDMKLRKVYQKISVSFTVFPACAAGRWAKQNGHSAPIFVANKSHVNLLLAFFSKPL